MTRSRLFFLTSLSLLACTQQADAPYMLSAADGLYGGVPLDEHLLGLDKAALEAAYIDRMQKLFQVWLSSGAPREAVQFRNGITIARQAYTQAAEEINKREKAIQSLPKAP